MSEGLHPEQVKALRTAMLRADQPDWTAEQIAAHCAILSCMPAPNPLAIFAPPLNRSALRWMAVGSVARALMESFESRTMSMVTDTDRELIEREITARGLGDAWRWSQ